MHVCIVLKGSFCNENVTKYFFWVYFAWNEMLTKFQIFHQNHGLAPLEKCQFCGFLNRCFHCPERLVCCIKRWKSFFHDLFSRSITWEYRGLEGVTGGDKGWQGVTRGDRGLQGVTGGYKGWQGVTRGYKGLQGVTRGYRGYMGWQKVTKDVRNFFLTRTFLDTFSWSILH